MTTKYTEALYPDTFYHVYSHAVGEENLFRSDENYNYFLEKYSQYTDPVCGTYAYCLMPNHFHFLIRVRGEKELSDFLKQNPADFQNQPDLVTLVTRQFSHLLLSYAKAYNKRYQRRGGLFVEPFRRKIVSTDRYLITLVCYIHYNAIHHGFCKNIDDWKFTSYHALRSKRVSKLQRAGLLEIFDGVNGFNKAHEKLPDQRLEQEFEMV